MPPFTATYSPAEKEACVTIYWRHGFVNDAVLDEIEQAIGKRPSTQIVRKWKRLAMQPKPKRKSPTKKVEATDPGEAIASNEMMKPGDEFHEPDENLTLVERIEQALDALSRRLASPEQLALLNGQALVKSVDTLIGTWLKLRDIDPAVLALAPMLQRFIAVCALGSLDAGQTILDVANALEARLLPVATATGATLPPNGELIELEPTAIIRRD